MRVADIRSRLELAKGHRQHIHKSLASEKANFSHYTAQAAYCAAAQLILQESARLTQEHLQYRISTLVTLAMESVFDDPYHLDIAFENARGKTQATIRFLRGEEAVDPLEASGGGAVDVASFGLQVSLWTLQTPRTRNVLVLDEPLKWLKGGGLPEKGADMLRQISHRLGIQIIMVSHNAELISSADKSYQVTKKRGISTVKEIK